MSLFYSDFYARSNFLPIRHLSSNLSIKSCRSQIPTDARQLPLEEQAVRGISSYPLEEQAVRGRSMTIREAIATDPANEKKATKGIEKNGIFRASSSSSSFCFLPPKAYYCKEALLAKTGDSPTPVFQPTHQFYSL